MTRTAEAARQPRKATVWTREKIAQLIQLYRQHECLWNHFTEGYKIKERRNKAIEDICTVLRITKFDFGKKVHNLRNQFNSEMKKLERRMEEAGGITGDSNSGQRCRWEHFESLRFLRVVIEPRPGGYQTGGCLSHSKKLRLKYDYNSEEDTVNATADDVTEYHNFEETTADGDTLAEQVGVDEFHNYDEGDALTSEKEESYDKKYNPPSSSTSVQEVAFATLPNHPISTTKTYFTRVHQVQKNQQQSQISHQQQDIISLDGSQNLPTGSVIELSTEACSIDNQTHGVTPSPHKQRDTSSFVSTRDQWDSFGELIASEFRHLNSDISRKKLKRKIMQAMLEVGEEDDGVAT